MSFFEKILRAGEGRMLRRLEAIAKAVNSIEENYESLTDDELRGLTGMRTDIGGWVAQDRTMSQVVEAFGPPSVCIGGTNPFYPRTFAYATADRHDDGDDDLICLHLWNALADTACATGVRGVYPEPVVLAARHRPGLFPDSFSFTPQGLHNRPSADDLDPRRRVVWLFHGDHARHASGVFDTLEDGLAWAAEYQVTGILAEYPHGGAYDLAVCEGRFTSSKPHHGTADHVAGFSPGLRHIHLTDGRPD